MRRPLLGIFMVWILGEIVAVWLGLSLVPATSLDRAMADKDSAEVTVTGSVCRFRRTTTGFSYELANCRVSLWGEELDTHHLLVFTDDISNLQIGNQVRVTGDLSPFSQPTNPGQFNMDAYYRASGIDYSLWEKRVEITDFRYRRSLQRLWEVREQMRAILTSIASEEDAGVYLSIFLGDRSAMDQDIRTMYQNGGIGHILAISGLHVSLFGMAVYRFLKKLGCPAWGNLAVSSGFLWGYVWMTGGAASSLRAWIMFAAFLLAGALGRTYDSLSALSLAGLLLLIRHPLLLFQSGFQLSFLAMVGVGWIYPMWESWWRLRLWVRKHQGCSKEEGDEEKDETWHENRPWIKELMRAASFSLAIQLVTLPVIVWSYYSIPVYSILLNLLVLPLTGLLLGSVAVCAGIMELVNAGMKVLPFLTAASGLMTGLGSGLLTIARSVLVWYQALCHLMERLPGSALITGQPARWQIALYLFLFAGGHLLLWADILRMDELRRQERLRQIHGRIRRNHAGREDAALHQESRDKVKISSMKQELQTMISQWAEGRSIHEIISEWEDGRGICETISEWMESRSIHEKISQWIDGRNIRELLSHMEGLASLRWDLLIPAWICILVLCLFRLPIHEVRITALDVGQGDCSCIQIPGGGCCLIDGGSSSVKKVGTYRILPFLKSQGIGRLKAIFITHGDLDHYSGLIEVLKDSTIQVESLCMAASALEDPELEEVCQLAETRKIPIRRITQGDQWNMGKVEFICLYPSTNAMENWEEDKNNTSLVLAMRSGAFTGVFTGDLAEEGELELIHDQEIREMLSEVDFLKVGHHGSRYSSCQEFLDVLQPDLVTISCGENNRYGHPHGEVLERLESVGADILRTDEEGAIQVTCDWGS